MRTQKATLTQQGRVDLTRETRLFIAAEIPEEINGLLSEKLRQYAPYIRRAMKMENWHLTFLFVGMINNFPNYAGALTQDLPQAFLPTITLTHVGRGYQAGQLWAFAKPTALLHAIKQALWERVAGQLPELSLLNEHDDFVPHIKLAELRDRSVSKFVADCPLLATWPIKQLFLYSSTVYLGEQKYEVFGTIKL